VIVGILEMRPPTHGQPHRKPPPSTESKAADSFSSRMLTLRLGDPVVQGQERRLLGAAQRQRSVDLVDEQGHGVPLADVGSGRQLLPGPDPAGGIVRAAGRRQPRRCGPMADGGVCR
jgi:hypothetical protein